MRRSTLMLWLAPSRSSFFSCSTRSNLACWARGMLSISSRNTVPPSAYSSLPMRLPWAPVNAPLSWPNSSASNSCSGMAAQFNATKGLSARGPKSCRQRATSSLPLPVSPRIKTLTGNAARSSTCRRRVCKPRDTPSRVVSSLARLSACSCRARFSRTSRRLSSARRRLPSKVSGLKGFSRKS
ncbi:hypothetical protein D3C86_1571020 [compost metagenome]